MGMLQLLVDERLPPLNIPLEPWIRKTRKGLIQRYSVCGVLKQHRQTLTPKHTSHSRPASSSQLPESTSTWTCRRSIRSRICTFVHPWSWCEKPSVRFGAPGRGGSLRAEWCLCSARSGSNENNENFTLFRKSTLNDFRCRLPTQLV